MTSHGAKGLEFDEVLFMGLTKDVWDKSRGSYGSFSYPPKIMSANETGIEDERRLVFVAMTRAERKLVMSYSLAKEDGKGLAASQFVDELQAAIPVPISEATVDEASISAYQYHTLSQRTTEIKLIDHDLIDRMLQGYTLSATALNKYLACPITFYFEGVLRVPMARTKTMGYGRAIHYALEVFFQHVEHDTKPGREDLIRYFLKGMLRHRAHFTASEYKDMSDLGKIVLDQYYEAYLKTDDIKRFRYKTEVKIDQAEYKGVPIKGILDLVTIIKGREVKITDYKTGNAQRRETANKLKDHESYGPLGGDYWRQMVFYNILLDSDRKYQYHMSRGEMDFVEPDRKTGAFTRADYVISREHKEVVGKQITDVWAAIHQHEFDRGCGEDHCRWCEFVKNDYVMDLDDISSADEDEIFPSDAFF